MTTDCLCLLQQLAVSKLCHFNQDVFPPNTMAYDMHTLSLGIVNLLKLTILVFGDGYSVMTRQCVAISLAAEN